MRQAFGYDLAAAATPGDAPYSSSLWDHVRLVTTPRGHRNVQGGSETVNVNGREFLWLSERDGWRRAYVISRDGSGMKPITAAGSDLIARGQVDDKNGWFYYLASPTNATQRYLYRARLEARIRQAPEQYLWTHRLWKQQPDSTS